MQTQNNDQKPLDNIINKDYIASELKKSCMTPEGNLDIHLTKERIKSKIIEDAKSSGSSIDSNAVDALIDKTLSETFEYKPVPESERKMANILHNRKTIGKKYGIPTLVTISSGLLLYFATSGTISWYKNASESKIEEAVKKSYSERIMLENELKKIKNTNTMFVQRETIAAVVEDGMENIEKTSEFFSKYCPDGDAKDEITPENYNSASDEFEKVNLIINDAKKELESGKNFLDLDNKLVGIKERVDKELKSINASSLQSNFRTVSKEHYDNTLEALGRLDDKDATAHASELDELAYNLESVKSLSNESQRVYFDIWTTSKELVDLKKTGSDISTLRNIEDWLRKELILRIVTREGIRSGVYKYYEDRDGSRSGNEYYLVVEAVDNAGKIVAHHIFDREDGNTYKVTIWAENVPEYIYDRVKNDKIDNGIIDNIIYGKKEIGYMSPKVSIIGNDGAPIKRTWQITRWDNN